MFMLSTSFVAAIAVLAALAPVRGAPAFAARHEGHDESTSTTSTGGSSLVKQNALEAQKLNTHFATIKAGDSCKPAEQACVNGGYAQCVAGKWIVQSCGGSLRCYALPLVNSKGTSLVCDTPDDAELRFKNAGVSGGTKGDASGSTSPDPVEEEEDIPDCDEVDEEVEPRTFGSDDHYNYFYRRQVDSGPVTLATLLPSEVPTSTVAPSTSAASASVSASFTAFPTSSVAAPASSSVGVVIPTVVIGSDGIVTVTVVSTVTATVTATDCGVSSGLPASATSIIVSSARPTAFSSALPSGSAVFFPPSSTTVPISSSVAVPHSSGSAEAGTTIILVPAPTSSTVLPPRFSFSTGGSFAAPTAP